MISEQSLAQTILNLLGNTINLTRLNLKKIASQLNDLSDTHDVELSSYGYVHYVLEHVGLSGIYKGQLASSNLMSEYASAARAYKEDMPMLLVNANQYVEKVFNVIQDPDLCITRLEGMTFPYVLYILFAGAQMEHVVDKYRHEAIEHLRKYPGTLALLPERYKNVGEEVLNNANIE